jgi:hypothetical protein
VTVTFALPIYNPVLLGFGAYLCSGDYGQAIARTTDGADVTSAFQLLDPADCNFGLADNIAGEVVDSIPTDAAITSLTITPMNPAEFDVCIPSPFPGGETHCLHGKARGIYAVRFRVEPVRRRLSVAIAATPRDVTPTLNPRCRTNAGRSRVTVTAEWSDGSSPAALDVTLRNDFEAASGGHMHQAADRPGFGRFTLASGRTDPQGQFSTDFIPDVVGGVERLTAVVSGQGQGVTAMTEINTRVVGLIQLVPGANVELGGATSAHPSNTFGTAFAIGKIVILADTFFQATGVKIPYNDMSLEFGGVFDLNNAFSPSEKPGHLGHRCGTEVDVVDKVGDRIDVLEGYLDLLVRSPLVRGSFARHGPGSYHLAFTR